MIYSLLDSCTCGLDLLAVYLLAAGYSRGEVADFLHLSPSAISRRLSRIYRAFKAEREA